MADEEAQVPIEEAPAEEEAKQSTGKRKAVKANGVADPSVEQAVHYVWNGSHTPGVVLEVFDDKVITLSALNGGIQAARVAFDEGGAEGTWHYPEE